MGFQRGGAAAPPIVERARRKPSEQQAKQEALRRLQTVDKVPFGGGFSTNGNGANKHDAGT